MALGYLKLRSIHMFKNRNNIWGIVIAAGKLEYWGPSLYSHRVTNNIGIFLSSSNYFYADKRYLVLNPHNNRLLFYGCVEAVRVAKMHTKNSSAWIFEAKKYTHV
jgi:hypothetical protein